MNFYIIIPEVFAIAMQSQQSTVNPNSLFGYAVTNDGRCACSINSVSDFPEEFSTLGTLTVEALANDEFPPSIESLLNME